MSLMENPMKIMLMEKSHENCANGKSHENYANGKRQKRELRCTFIHVLFVELFWLRKTTTDPHKNNHGSSQTFCPPPSPLWCIPTRVMVSLFLKFLGHTQRRTTVRRTPLHE